MPRAGTPGRLAAATCRDDDSVQHLTEFFRETIEFVEQDLSIDLRRRVPLALLDLAVARLIAREGRGRAAAILADVANTVVPTQGAAFLRPVHPTGGALDDPPSRPVATSSAAYRRSCGR